MTSDELQKKIESITDLQERFGLRLDQTGPNYRGI